MAQPIHPIDKHVGDRVRLRRLALGVTRERLGDILDLTPEMIQKYEAGTSRIGARLLYDISRILFVPVQFFFENLPEECQPEETDLFGDGGSASSGTIIRRRIGH